MSDVIAPERTDAQRNLIALGTIVRREVHRIVRIWG
ncbi:MAG TPA: ABC transporter permease, partial [Lysobacter sp.]